MPGKIKHRELSAHTFQELEHHVQHVLQHARDAGTLRDLLAVLLTRSELVMLGRRMVILKRLLAGKSHEDIRRELHVGLATIEPLQRWVSETGLTRKDLSFGYEQVARAGRPWPFADVRRKHPLHFFLIHLFLQDLSM